MLLLEILGCSESQLRALAQAPPTTDPEILVEPAEIDFSTVPVGCEDSSPLTVRNVGDATLELTGVHLEGDQLADLSVESTEALLLPGAEVQLAVKFAPSAVGDVAARVDVASDDPDEPSVSVPLAAAGEDASRRVDRFRQDPQSVDVLWVIDNSGSMVQEKERITMEIDKFISWFDHLGLDFHMGVVTTDVVNPIFQGKLVGEPPYVTSHTPNAAAILAAAIQFDGVEMGNEAGLEAMEWALSEPLVSGANTGFYRPDARLAAIFVTDEPEQSLYNSAYYISFLNTLKPDPEDVFIAAIVGDRQHGCANTCDGMAQTADPGDKYLDVAEAFHGFEQSICTCDLAPALEKMGLEATWYTRTFSLSDKPVEPKEIEVWVDQTLAKGWSYDANANAIVFDASPPVGSEVVVRYQIPVICGS